VGHQDNDVRRIREPDRSPATVTDSPIGWVARHTQRYVPTDGQDGAQWYGHDSLLLVTRGRRTGRPRRTALFYWRDGDDYLVVVSNGGRPRYPDWYLNLIADPQVAVQVGADLFPAQAHLATALERPRLWNLVIEGMPRYAMYRRKAGRDLPVIVLRRLADAASSGSWRRPGSA
jgi:deazaflavin-dependent oxidoreductase (nitroreductase family)